MPDLYVLRVTACASCKGRGAHRGTWRRWPGELASEWVPDDNGPHRKVCDTCKGAGSREERVPLVEALREVGDRWPVPATGEKS